MKLAKAKKKQNNKKILPLEVSEKVILEIALQKAKMKAKKHFNACKKYVVQKYL